jgi:hypothetical protein
MAASPVVPLVPVWLKEEWPWDPSHNCGGWGVFRQHALALTNTRIRLLPHSTWYCIAILPWHLSACIQVVFEIPVVCCTCVYCHTMVLVRTRIWQYHGTRVHVYHGISVRTRIQHYLKNDLCVRCARGARLGRGHRGVAFLEAWPGQEAPRRLSPFPLVAAQSSCSAGFPPRATPAGALPG